MRSVAIICALFMGMTFAAPGAQKRETNNGWVHNNCNVPLYIFSAADPSECTQGQSCTMPQISVPAGGSYQVPLHPVDGSAGGVTVKFNTVPDESVVYQAEYSIRNGLVWYNWSGVNGSPLINFRREMQIGDGTTCAQSICEPGSNSCNWYEDASGANYNIYSCPVEDIVMNIC
jgi:hypothetical protein